MRFLGHPDVDRLVGSVLGSLITVARVDDIHDAVRLWLEDFPKQRKTLDVLQRATIVALKEGEPKIDPDPEAKE